MPVLPSHKYSATYLEHCRIVMSDERLAYIKAEDAVERSFSIPYANTNILLLGPGTSITHQAARLLGEEGVMLAFVAGGASPMYLASVNEYRPTEYLQGWCKFWFDEAPRLKVAKNFQLRRCEQIQKVWTDLVPGVAVAEVLGRYTDEAQRAVDNSALLLAEARFSKSLFALLSREFRIKEFVRTPRGGDKLNEFLDAGNYMAYGFASCALWVLGIPHGMGVNHGTTRRGALVFDVADLIKDACILPNAFIGFAEGEESNMNRRRMLLSLENNSALSIMLNEVTKAASTAATPSCGK